MLYAMSDIHGYLLPLEKALERIALGGGDRLVLLGDYIDYGPESGQVLRRLYELQRERGADRVIVLRGNHEEAFLEWLDTYAGPGAPDERGLLPWNGWLERDVGFRTCRTLVSKKRWEALERRLPWLSDDALNRAVAEGIWADSRELIDWLRGLAYYYETERQIFVHAGIDEEYGEWWRKLTPRSMFVLKYPPARGRFYKDVIAGHTPTSRLAGDPGYHGVYFDGASHYYIDGSVSACGRVAVLAFDEETGKYRSL